MGNNYCNVRGWPPRYVYEAVFGLYHGSYGWMKKVQRMPAHQVWGIYNDRILKPRTAKQLKDMANNLRKNSKVNDIWRDKEEDDVKPMQYCCPHCWATYARDNPDLKYCEYCNQQLEMENDYDRYIEAYERSDDS